MQSLAEWSQRHYRLALEGMLASVSPVGIVKVREGLAQQVRPRRGSIVASPVLAAYDPDPDYFFHWYRDSAVVLDALRLAWRDGEIGEAALGHFADFIDFSTALAGLDGGGLLTPQWRARVTPHFKQYLRTDQELAAVHGDAVAAETRVNPDGTLDVLSWPRPQHDGPALRALAVLAWLEAAPHSPAVRDAAAALARADLEFAYAHALRPCFDMWEEERGLHYYVLRVSAAALTSGADWIAGRDPQAARRFRAEGQAILQRLEGYWLPQAGMFRSRVLESGSPSMKELDIAVVLAALHAEPIGAAPAGARRPGALDAPAAPLAHSVHDPRIHATLRRLEAHFETEYPINHGRPAGRGPALGRYPNDTYYSGGAYFFSTLGAAELCYRAAGGADDDGSFLARGDAYLETVRAWVPASGEMAEQFDRHTGEPRSARELAWSYAALLSCLTARRAASAPSSDGAARSAKAAAAGPGSR